MPRCPVPKPPKRRENTRYIEILYKMAMDRNRLNPWQVADIVGLLDPIQRRKQQGWRSRTFGGVGIYLRDSALYRFHVFIALGKLAGLSEPDCLALYVRDEIPEEYRHLRQYIGSTTKQPIGLYPHSKIVAAKWSTHGKKELKEMRRLYRECPGFALPANPVDLADLPNVKLPKHIQEMLPR